MDEEISLINTKTRNEKIKRFFIENIKSLILSISIIIILVLSYYSYQIYKDGYRERLSDKYNNAVIEHKNGDKIKSLSIMKEIIKSEDSTYSPLALYYLIDNSLIENLEETNELFDILIKKTSLEKEIKNLIIYKKALYNSDFVNENNLLNILNPLINSESIWKSHALYLIGEYFYSKNEKQKSKEFFSKIISEENSNTEIIKAARIRLDRDLSE